MRVLYISYDGFLEPLGKSQVWQYVRGLSQDHQMFLLTFEKPKDWSGEEPEKARQEAKNSSVKWVPLSYHKTPTIPATSFDILQGIMVAGYLCARYRIEIVHARSYVAAVIALVLKLIFGVRFVFDMRGFWPDERVDGGLWRKESAVYRIAKVFEKKFMQKADVIVSLTHAGKREIERFPFFRKGKPIIVIPTCTNLETFHPADSIRRFPDSAFQEYPFRLGYVGSVGVWYLFDEVLRFFIALRKVFPKATLTIMNKGDHPFISERISAMNAPQNAIFVRSGNHQECAEMMQQVDAGIFFIKPVFSKLASAPTKMGEFLACGVPCISNVGVGDVRDILEGNKVGVCLPNFSEPTMEQRISDLITLLKSQGIRERCVQTASTFFSLEKGIKDYDKVYQKLSDTTKNPA
jgi:glycosyltransferase involved in cell wall biosynthesis